MVDWKNFTRDQVVPNFPPEAFFQEICFDNRGLSALQRPKYQHVFECRIHPAFDETWIDHILDIATGASDGAIGFIRSKNSHYNLLIGIHTTPTENLADTKKDYNGKEILGGEILFSSSQYIHEPKPILHELGHMMGLYHVQPPWNYLGNFIMGGAPLSQDFYLDYEKLAIKRLMSTPL